LLTLLTTNRVGHMQPRQKEVYFYMIATIVIGLGYMLYLWITNQF